MKLLLVVGVTIICLCVGAPISGDIEAKIHNYKNQNDGLGNYEFSFETSNGISRSETGRLVNVGEPNEHIEVLGEYSYTDPDGNPVIVRYSADKSGYHIDLLPIMRLLTSDRRLAPHIVASLLG